MGATISEGRPAGFSLWGLPNLLTLVRFPLAIVLWLAPHSAPYLFAMAGLAGVSDILDGWAARSLRARAERQGSSPQDIERSRALGAWLDPVCDKTFMASLLAVLWVAGHAPLGWLLLIAARDFVQAVLVAVYHVVQHVRRRVSIDFTAGAIGKLATVAQFFAVAMVLVEAHFAFEACVATATLGLIAVGYYVQRTLQASNGSTG